MYTWKDGNGKERDHSRARSKEFEYASDDREKMYQLHIPIPIPAAPAAATSNSFAPITTITQVLHTNSAETQLLSPTRFFPRNPKSLAFVSPWLILTLVVVIVVTILGFMMFLASDLLWISRHTTARATGVNHDLFAINTEMPREATNRLSETEELLENISNGEIPYLRGEMNVRSDGIPWSSLHKELERKFKPYWPKGGVDLVIRTYSASITVMPLFFDSIDRFWPKNIGRCIIILDEGLPEIAVATTAPEWCEIYHERAPYEMNGYWMQQWSNMWADNYTSADYVAFFDADSILTTLVTPDVVFDSDGRVIHTLMDDFQRGVYDRGTSIWLGDIHNPMHLNYSSYQDHKYKYWPLNFMIRLPIIFPRELFAAFRNYVLVVHNRHLSRNPNARTNKYFDDFNYEFVSMHRHAAGCQFCILGTYWYYHSTPEILDKLAVVWQHDASNLPIARPGVHVPYSVSYIEDGERVGQKEKFTYTTLYRISYELITLGFCNLFPPRFSMNFTRDSSKCNQVVDNFSYGETAENYNWMEWYMPGCESRWPSIPQTAAQISQNIHYINSFRYSTQDRWKKIVLNQTAVIYNAYFHRQNWLQQLTSRIYFPLPSHNLTYLSIIQSCYWQSTDPIQLDAFLAQYPRPDLWIDISNPWQLSNTTT